MNYKSYIRDVPDFPKPGILFKDITPLLMAPAAFSSVIADFAERFRAQGIVKVFGIESRGFIFGAALATALGVGFVPVRKFGKLPWKKIAREYQLEYGTDRLEIHVDAVAKGERVLIVDDLLATGGTARAVCDLVREMGAEVAGLAVLIELTFLPGREALKGYDVFSLVQY